MNIRFAAALTLALVFSASVSANGLPDGPYISTSASATEEFEPDYAVIDLRFRTEQSTPEQARARTNEAQRQLLAVLEANEQALRDQHVQSLEFGESFNFDHQQQRRVRSGFYGSFSVQLEVDDFAALKPLHYQLAGLAWDSLSNPRFEVDNREQAEQRVREGALEKAVKQAQALADHQGAELGSIWGIIYEPMHDLAGRSPGVFADSMMHLSALGMPAEESQFALSIEPRPVVLQAQVGVVYALQTEP